MIWIFGHSDYAIRTADYLSEFGDDELAGFVVDNPHASEMSSNVVSTQQFLDRADPTVDRLLSCIGYRSMRNRKSVFDRLRAESKVEFTSLVHPSAYVHSSVSIGENCLVMPGAVVESHARLGDGVTVWSNATVCHDVAVGDHAFLAAGCTVGGGSTVGEASFLGFGSTVVQGLEVPPETLLGANSLLLQCDTAHGQYLGVPARLTTTHAAGGVKVNQE